MDNTLLLFACVALGAAAILFVVAAVVLWKVRAGVERSVASIEALTTDVHEIRIQLEPVMQKAMSSLTELDLTMQAAREPLRTVNRGAEVALSMMNDVKRLETDVVDAVRQPLKNTLDVVGSILSTVTQIGKGLADRFKR